MSSQMKLWAGRFEGQTDDAVDSFNSSLGFDCRLWRQDIRGSIAHAQMLGRQGIIPTADADAITAGLQTIYDDIDTGKVAFGDAEDIHMFVEALLTERIGEAGKRLHTGRSRNDQVALDCRMYVMDSCGGAIELIKALATVLADNAKLHAETIMPGFTHLQKAQPITLGFHLMAYVEMLTRDASRFADCRKRCGSMPLGSGALAGTTYPLDRQFVADKLGFPSVTQNALDAVSDRDFVLDFIYACSVTMMHMSRLCEEIILWASDEYKFITLSDSFSTGSSIMPQKKNPDVAELIRGKTGRVYGDLLSLLTTMKGLPLAYNKDMQEDKEALFDAEDTLFACLVILAAMLACTKFNTPAMERSAASGFTNATDAADYLVGQGIAFREAHEIIGKMVLHCIKEGKSLDQLTEMELKGFSPLINTDFYEAISLYNCVQRRALTGGPAAARVREHVAKAKIDMESWR
jgi:argininosuccinate lyase